MFGSSEPQAGEPLYELARQLGRFLAEAGFLVVSGGYGGVMEGPSRGAREAGGQALGITTDSFAGRGAANRFLTREIREPDLPGGRGLNVLMSAPETGPCMIEDPAHRALYMFNHIEYDTTSLDEEYRRDIAAGTPIGMPVNYYHDNDPASAPENRWRSHAHLLFGNWINQVYQTAPFDSSKIGG